MQLEKLVGPVYDVEHKSGFQDIIQNVEKIKNLAGPVYDVAHSNHFQDVMKGVDKVRTKLNPQSILRVLNRCSYKWLKEKF